MKTILVPDMMCENCVKRITEALKSAGLTFTVNLEKKVVEVEGDGAVVNTAISELEDLGFTPKA